MTISFNSDRMRVSARWTQIGFLTIAVLFNLCLVAQLLTVGLALFYDPQWWNTHVWLVRGYSGLAAILLLGAFLNPFPGKVQRLTGSLVVLLGLQFLTIHLNRSLSVFHPLTGFMLFTTSTTLVHRAWRMVFPDPGAITSTELNLSSLSEATSDPTA